MSNESLGKSALTAAQQRKDLPSRHDVPPALSGQIAPSNANALMNEQEWLLANNIRMTTTGLDLPLGIDEAAWEALGRKLAFVGKGSQWWVGDWLYYGIFKYGTKYDKAAELTRMNAKTLKNIQHVASKFEKSRRRDFLSFGHHEVVAGLPEEWQEHLLQIAENENLSVADLRVRMAQELNASTQVESVAHELADKEQRKRFNRVWSALEKGKAISKEDVQALRAWLRQIENKL